MKEATNSARACIRRSSCSPPARISSSVFGHQFASRWCFKTVHTCSSVWTQLAKSSGQRDDMLDRDVPFLDDNQLYQESHYHLLSIEVQPTESFARRIAK